MNAIVVQINVHISLLKRKLPAQEKIIFSKSSIDELKKYMVALMAVEVTDELQDLFLPVNFTTSSHKLSKVAFLTVGGE